MLLWLGASSSSHHIHLWISLSMQRESLSGGSECWELQAFIFFIFLLNFSWPSTSSVEPKDFLNKGPIVTIFGLESTGNLESAVDQLSTHLANLNLPTVIVFDPRFKSSVPRYQAVLQALENSQILDRVS